MAAALSAGTVNPDLERERAQCSFKPEELAVWWHGGADNLRKKREIGTNDSHIFKCFVLRVSKPYQCLSKLQHPAPGRQNHVSQILSGDSLSVVII